MTDLLYWLFVQQSAWITSVISGVMMWQMGNRRWWAPWLGLVGQIFWLLLALYVQQPGMLPGIALYTVIHIRNARKWWLEDRATCKPDCFNGLCICCPKHHQMCAAHNPKAEHMNWSTPERQAATEFRGAST